MSKTTDRHQEGERINTTVQKQLRRAERRPGERKLRLELLRMRTGIWKFEMRRILAAGKDDLLADQ